MTQILYEEVRNAWELGKFEDVVRLVPSRTEHADLSRLRAEAEAALALEKAAAETKLPSVPTVSSGPKSTLRVLTVLHTSLPYLPGGYSSRAHGLLKAMQKAGLEVIPVTRPGFYTDVVDKTISAGTEIRDRFDGLDYCHLFAKLPRSAGEYQYMLSCIEVYEETFARKKPDVIHVRSTYLIALPAIIAAHKCGIRVIYEVSGLWELVYEGRGQMGLAKRTARMEDLSVLSADRVVTMNASMAKLLSDRASQGNLKIGYVPNAVDPTRFEGVPGLESTIASAGYDIGYFGSLLDYEGLDLLIRALAKLQRQGSRYTAKIVGGGPELNKLKALAESVGLKNSILFTGSLEPDSVPREFSDVRVVVLPRVSTPATECVTPLKPFEAMAARRPMVVSNVNALFEVAQGGEKSEIAKTFKQGDVDSLADALEELCSNPELQVALANKAFAFMEKCHTWDLVGEMMANECRNVGVPFRPLPQALGWSDGRVHSRTVVNWSRENE